VINANLSAEWQQSEAWVACFDIMGFKNISQREDLFTSLLQDGIGELIQYIQREAENSLKCILLSDTFIFYTPDGESNNYTQIINISKGFIKKCVTLRIPVRGAISFGKIVRGHQDRCLMGDAFLDAFQYCEDQDWIGLILTPKAIYRTRKLALHPSRTSSTIAG
jgi:hypothetical protein